MATFKALNQMEPAMKQALVKMHQSKKVSFDLFDFPGSRASMLDTMMVKFGVVVGNHANGFSISKRGADYAAKSSNS